MEYIRSTELENRLKITKEVFKKALSWAATSKTMEAHMPYRTPIDSCRWFTSIQHTKWFCITTWPVAISDSNSMMSVPNILRTQLVPWKKESRLSTNKNRTFYSKILKRPRTNFKFYSNQAGPRLEKMGMIHMVLVHLVWVKSKIKSNLINTSETVMNVG